MLSAADAVHDAMHWMDRDACDHDTAGRGPHLDEQLDLGCERPCRRGAGDAAPGVQQAEPAPQVFLQLAGEDLLLKRLNMQRCQSNLAECCSMQPADGDSGHPLRGYQGKFVIPPCSGLLADGFMVYNMDAYQSNSCYAALRLLHALATHRPGTLG